MTPLPGVTHTVTVARHEHARVVYVRCTCGFKTQFDKTLKDLDARISAAVVQHVEPRP
jgi:hypothetical protein